MSKLLIAFSVDFGRHGELQGLFTCTREELDEAMGKEIHFGDALGKHSDISIELEPSHIEIKSEDQDFICKFDELLPYGTGYDPVATYFEQKGE